MFHLTLTPIRMEASLAVAVKGDTLILNGEALDFAALPEGAVAAARCGRLPVARVRRHPPWRCDPPDAAAAPRGHPLARPARGAGRDPP